MSQSKPDQSGKRRRYPDIPDDVGFDIPDWLFWLGCLLWIALVVLGVVL